MKNKFITTVVATALALTMTFSLANGMDVKAAEITEDSLVAAEDTNVGNESVDIQQQEPVEISELETTENNDLSKSSESITVDESIAEDILATQADTAVVVGTVSDYLTAKGDAKLYNINLPAGVYLQAQLTTPANADLDYDLYLLDAEGNILTGSDYYTYINGTAGTLPEALGYITSGDTATYYLYVLASEGGSVSESFTLDYSVSTACDSYEIDESVRQALAFTYGAGGAYIESRNLSSPIDNDWYVITVPSSRTYDKLKIYASSQKVSIPDSYNLMVENRVDRCLKENVPAKYKIHKTVAAAVVVAIALVGTGGVYAAKNYIFDRMDSISDTEKEDYVSQVNKAAVDADSYSRELTDDEINRFKELQRDYENSGKFPKNKLKSIDSPDKADSDKVCFEENTSTFYLPEKLSDEDILEIIDFCYSRDYSLSQYNKNELSNQNVEENISEQDAVNIAKETVARVYGIDIHNVDVDVEHDMSNGSDGTFSSEYVYITDKSSGIEYSAAVDMQSVTVYYVEKNLAEYSSSSELENKPLYEQKAVEAENIAEKFMNYNEGWSKKEIEYAINSEKMLRKGIIDFYFTTKDGNVCKVSYSQSEDTFYSICVIDEKVCEAMRASYEEASQEQENAVIKTIIK